MYLRSGTHQTNKGRIRKLAVDFLAYALIDSIIDSYYVILERIEEKIENAEDDLVVQAFQQHL